MNHVGKVVSKKGNYDVIKCNNCKFTHIVPIPSDQELLQFYANHFYQEVKPEYIKKYETEHEYWTMVFDDKLDLLETQIPKTVKRILDIGCGAGFFLMRAKSRGWDVLGIEPSEQAAAYARERGINIIQDFFQNISSSTVGKFDVIHMRFFLEHSTSPDNIIESCDHLLANDGIMIIEVPNDYNHLQKAVQQALDKHEYWVAIPDHINYFNLEGITNLLERHKMKIFHTESTFPLELFLLMGHDYVENDVVGKEIHSKRMALELNLKRGGANELKRTIYSLFSKHGIGREMIIYARRS